MCTGDLDKYIILILVLNIKYIVLLYLMFCMWFLLVWKMSFLEILRHVSASLVFKGSKLDIVVYIHDELGYNASDIYGWELGNEVNSDVPWQFQSNAF